MANRAKWRQEGGNRPRIDPSTFNVRWEGAAKNYGREIRSKGEEQVFSHFLVSYNPYPMKNNN
jgi:hypothetical protein